MCVFLISPVPITKPLTSELIDTPVFYNLAPRPIKYRVSVPIPTDGRWTILAMSPILFWALTVLFTWQSMGESQASRFSLKIS